MMAAEPIVPLLNTQQLVVLGDAQNGTGLRLDLSTARPQRDQRDEVSSVSPERWETITPQPLARDWLDAFDGLMSLYRSGSP